MGADLGFQQFASFVTNDLGLHFDIIQRTSEKTADVFVNGDNPGYAIEIKARCNRDNFIDELSTGGPVLRVEDPVFDNWYIRKANEAERQLRSIDPDRSRLWLMWIDTNNRTESSMGFEQAVATLFGIRRCIDREYNGYECLHAKRSLFECVEHIDGFVLSDDEFGTAICPNECGDRIGSLFDSRVYRHFESIGHVISSATLCESGRIAVDPREVDRQDIRTVTNYIEEAYGLQGVEMVDVGAFVSNIKLRR